VIFIKIKKEGFKMSLENLIIFLVIGAIAGWLAGNIMKGRGFGLVGNIVVGIIGAIIGGYLFGVLGISIGGGLLGSIIVSTAGAAVLLFLVGILKK